MTQPLFQKIRGMHDILPGETHAWERVESAYRAVAAAYGYREIRIPVLEATGLFARSIGDETDIVGKEMYSFKDAGGDDLTLRPEGTAGVVRAYVEHSIPSSEPVSKWYYVGPMFRRERPQKGRYRQFHQAGAEVLGAPPPFADAELAIMLADFFGHVGLAGSTIRYNHLGGSEARSRFRGKLEEYYGGKKDSLCDDCKRRLETNPLRLLDCKVESCVALKAGAPAMRECLSEGDVAVLGRYRALLDESGVASAEEPRLVRGLDYYTGIVFEVEVATASGPVVVCGGGRYDDLVGRLGGPSTPAAGYAIGLERLMESIPEIPRPGLDLFVLVPGPASERAAARLLREARAAGIGADIDPRGGSMKSQMKRADRLGAAVVAILRKREIAAGVVSIKDMRTGDQAEVPSGDAIMGILERLGR